MKCKYSVSLEFQTNPPLTHKGIIQASSPRTIAARAIDETLIEYPNRSWTSIVILLERDSNEIINNEISELTKE